MELVLRALALPALLAAMPGLYLLLLVRNFRYHAERRREEVSLMKRLSEPWV